MIKHLLTHVLWISLVGLNTRVFSSCHTALPSTEGDMEKASEVIYPPTALGSTIFPAKMTLIGSVLEIIPEVFAKI